MTSQSGRVVWIAAAFTLLLQLHLTGFFSMGEQLPLTIDLNPGKYHDGAFEWPPRSSFLTHYFLGLPNYPAAFEPASLFARLPGWIFFTLYFPLLATLSLLACYLLLRDLDFSPVISTLGGLAYAWQGDLFSSILPGHFPAPAIWASFPLALLFALRACRHGSWFYAACCGAFTGLMILLLPDRGALCSLVIGACFLIEIAGRKKKGIGTFFQPIGMLLLTIVVALLVALPGLLSIFQTHVADIERPAPENIKEQFNWATQWSFAPEDIITYPVPGFMGWFQDDPAGPYWGRIGQSQGWIENHQGLRNFCQVTFSIGTVAFILAMIGLLRLWREPSSGSSFTTEQYRLGRFLSIAAGIAFILALGKNTPVYFYLFKLPGMSTWRNPLKFLMPVNLILIICAAYGAQYLSALLSNQATTVEGVKKRISLRFGLLCLGFLIAWLLSFVLIIPLAVRLARFDYTSEQRAAIFSSINLSLFLAMLCLFIVWLAWRIFSWPDRFRGLRFINPYIQKMYDTALAPRNLGASWLTVCMVVIGGQMFWVQSHYVQLYNFKDMYVTPKPFLEKLMPAPGESPFRVKVEMSDTLLYQWLSSVFPYYGISSIDIDAISRMPADYVAFFGSLQSSTARLLQLAGVKYWLMPTLESEKIKADPALSKNIANIFYSPLLPTGRPGEASHALIEFRDYLPKALLVPSVEVLPTRGALLTRLKDPSWNPRDKILVTDARLANHAPVQDAKTAAHRELPPVKITQYDEKTIKLETDTPEAAYLLIDDRYQPGWKASINGRPAEIFRADYILRGLALPSGHSTVDMNFEPLLFDKIPPVWPIYIEMGVFLLLALAALLRLSLSKAASANELI